MVVYFEGAIGTTQEVSNLPAGGTILIQSDEDLTLAWFDPNTKAYGETQAISEPQGELKCPSYKALIGTTTTANIRIVAGA